MSEKIRPQHLARKAMLYVRQSSPYQVVHKGIASSSPSDLLGIDGCAKGLLKPIPRLRIASY
jgi:hypothetical protein